MKRFISAFLLRGLIACGSGPVVLALIYLLLKRFAGVETLDVDSVCIGIVSLTFLAFAAGGMNAVYQIEKLPIMSAILIHGGVLYICYLSVYLINGWLKWGMVPIFVFSAIFVVGYFVVWAVIYFVTRNKTEKLNAMLEEKRHNQ